MPAQLDSWDYVRIQAQLDLQCKRCGTCCIDTDPIDLFPKDIRRIASFLNITEEKAIQEYTIPHPTISDHLAMKHSLPCGFYDLMKKRCNIYPARPTVCRCCPFLSPEQLGLQGIKLYRDCPASKEGYERIQKNVNSLKNPDQRTRKKLEKEFSKLLQIK